MPCSIGREPSQVFSGIQQIRTLMLRHPKATGGQDVVKVGGLIGGDHRKKAIIMGNSH